MSEPSHPQAQTPNDEPTGSSGTPRSSGTPTGSRLPFGPFGMLIVTAVALAVAALAAWGALAVLSNDKDSEATNVTDALDGVKFTPFEDSKESGSKGTARVGDQAPNVELDLINGGSTTLAKLAGNGKPVLLNFWSTTCAPCLKEMPAFESVNQDLDDKVLFLGINIQDSVKSAKKMIDKTGITYDSARDPKGEISARYGALALPRTVLIDGDGKIVATHTGALERDALIALLKKHDFPIP